MARVAPPAACALATLLPQAAPAAEWPAQAAAFAPALRACLAGEAAAFALDAMPTADGRVLVRLRRGAVAEECLVTPDGTVLARERRAAPPPDPAAPAFFLERRCVDARRLDGPDGAVLGWLAYPGC